MSPIAQLVGVSKRFGSTQALRNANLDVEAGSVHAVVGENGAGKSTLGKVLAGLYSPDSGHVLIDGEETGRWTVKRAQQNGIVMIAQELSLVPDLTVAQSIFLGREDHQFGLLRNNLRRRFDELDAIVEFGLDPNAKVSRLKIAEQQKVEIMRALARDARLLILDEPTSSLTGHETEQLHAIMRNLVSHGSAVIYVSHFLDAVLEVSDSVSVMRNGERVLSASTSGLTKSRMVTAMLGRKFESAFPERRASPTAAASPLLEVSEISGAGVANASLTVRPGEIVGLLGLVGSGRTEIARLIFGADQLTKGRIRYLGGDLPAKRRISDSIRRGMAMVPEDRHGQGLFLQRTIGENVSFNNLHKFTRGGLLRLAQEEKEVTKIVTEIGVRPPDIKLDVEGLSGGNQQKVLLGKWLLGRPSLVILDEPTRGVDIGAKLSIYELIHALAESGAGVLLISSEHEEVLSLADRAHLISDGRTIGEVDPRRTSVADVLEQLFAAQETKEPKYVV
jgi:ABC-type sugar transport system ATPase subunit